jgi:hypothetical protein
VTKYTDKVEGKEKELGGLLKVKFGAPDAWFEEAEQVFVHPKDPYKVRALLPLINTNNNK